MDGIIRVLVHPGRAGSYLENIQLFAIDLNIELCDGGLLEGDISNAHLAFLGNVNENEIHDRELIERAALPFSLPD